METWLIWIIIGIVLLILEMLTPAMLLASMAIGAFAASIFSYFDFHYIIQGAIFCIVSIVLIVFARPIIKKYLSSSQNGETNINAYAGKKGKVIQDISNKDEQGRIKIFGEEWVARSENGEDIEEGTIVEIVKVESMIAYVKKSEE